MLTTSRKVIPWLVLVVVAAAGERAQAEPASAWRATQIVAAAEAHQAAAADEEFFYAINSTHVGKYDRSSGERIALSEGRAEHLNSGTIWQGKLYCAHSNYPQKPDRSDIKVLDPATMRLEVYKDFGESDGSLTWVVRHAGHWWCTFAYYGADNAKTYLAKFDDDWQELARWTYPGEMVPWLGRHAISGGVWHGDELLATDHDNRVLYRLRLPDEGSSLQLLARVPAPFTGQGIAVDPVTGGLIGVDRPKKQIILAEPVVAEDLP